MRDRKEIYRLRIGTVLLVVILLINQSIISHAYEKTGYKFSKPGAIKFFISSNASSYNTLFVNTIPTWGSYANNVYLKKVNYSTDANIIIYYDAKNINSYGTTQPSDTNHYKIYFHKPFSELSDIRKKEVVIHEVGHALGLAHTQPANYSWSVMWDGQNGAHFHNVAYPLGDDVTGVNNIYKTK